MKNEYYYVACDGGGMVNKEYRHYYRLYKRNGEVSKLVDQGLTNKIPSWEKEYSAALEYENPYPNLD